MNSQYSAQPIKKNKIIELCYSVIATRLIAVWLELSKESAAAAIETKAEAARCSRWIIFLNILIRIRANVIQVANLGFVNISEN